MTPRTPLSACVSAMMTAATIADPPNEYLFAQSWGLCNEGQFVHGQTGTPGIDIDWLPFWERWESEPWRLPPVTVAVVDSGVCRHEQFGVGGSCRLLDGWSIDGVEGDDDCPHGTGVAGIIASDTDDNGYIAGIHWTAKVLPVRAFVACDGGQAGVAEGIYWSVDHGAQVINLSIQYEEGEACLQEAIDYATAQGVVCVAASGNVGGHVAYPGAFGEAISVGAVDSRGTVPMWSGRGDSLDVVAPGVNILTIAGTHDIEWADGTSYACAYVSGVAACLLAENPWLTPDDVARLIRLSARDLGPPGWDEATGWGLVDLEGACRLARCPADCDGDGVTDLFDFLCFEAAWSASDSYGDFDGSRETNLFDFLAFVNAVEGCE